ncbi:hypothetical protein EDD22DRAFT_849510 [Suillus occidentalis]|nr:hypothetical protein EDD22DRAFT_849510 [Suillus occidentalis]
MIDDACAAPRGSNQPSIQVLVPATSKESKYPSKSGAPALSTVVSGPMSKEKTEAHTQNEDDDALAPLKYQLEKKTIVSARLDNLRMSEPGPESQEAAALKTRATTRKRKISCAGIGTVDKENLVIFLNDAPAAQPKRICREKTWHRLADQSLMLLRMVKNRNRQQWQDTTVTVEKK